MSTCKLSVSCELRIEKKEDLKNEKKDEKKEDKKNEKKDEKKVVKVIIHKTCDKDESACTYDYCKAHPDFKWCTRKYCYNFLNKEKP